MLDNLRASGRLDGQQKCSGAQLSNEVANPLRQEESIYRGIVATTPDEVPELDRIKNCWSESSTQLTRYRIEFATE